MVKIRIIGSEYLALIDLALGALAVLLATSAGAVAVILFKCIDKTKYSAMLAFSAGVMAYSALEMLIQSHRISGDLVVLGGFLAGLAALMFSEKILPHVHRHIRKKDLSDGKKKAALVAGTIAIHNIPEGLSIATAFSASVPLGWFITTSIAIQDVPEGALVSTPLACYGMERKRSIMFGVFSGAAEAAAAIAGYFFLSFFSGLVPISLAFSGGAMAYVIIVELLPDALSGGAERLSALSFTLGACSAFLIASMLAV